MSKLTIYEIPDQLGEECWRVGLFDSQDIKILESINTVNQGRSTRNSEGIEVQGIRCANC